jgi:hypothetical protein
VVLVSAALKGTNFRVSLSGGAGNAIFDEMSCFLGKA